MAFKFFVLCALFAAANAGDLLAGGPIATYSSAPAVSHVYSSLATAPAKTISYGAPLAAVHAAPIHTSGVLSAAPIAQYSPAAAVSHSYSSIAAPAALTYAAPAHVALHTPAIGSSQQNIIRSFDGTISQHSKAVDTAFSTVRKVDTRINNNVYAPAKTLAYAAPIAKIASPAYTYTSHSAPALYAAASPAVYATHHTAPAVYATQHTGPAVYATHHTAPAVYATQHSGPAVYATQHTGPAVYATHHTAPALYSAPAATAYSTKAISYSPAATVAHVSFDGYGTHYGW